MGGGGNPVQDLIDTARDIGETITTGGANKTEEGKKIKKAGDRMIYSASGQQAEDVAQAETRNAQIEQGKREAAIAEQEAIAKKGQKNSQLRARQRAGGGQGRSSTILTSSLGAPSSGQAAGGKTLLGS